MVCFHTRLGFQVVGINRSLSEEPDSFELCRFLGEHLDEFLADDMALGFGLVNAGQQVEEAVGCVDEHEVRVHLVLEHVDDLLRFAFAHESMVHVNAHELLADGLDEQRRHDRGIDAAGKREQHLSIADLGAHGLDGLVDKGVGKFGRRYALHVVGAFVRCEIHGRSFLV